VGYTTTDLIDEIKTRGTIPTSQSNWTVPKLLALATDVMRLHIVPVMSAVREEYFIASHDTALTPSVTAVKIHERAVGSGLRDVEWTDGLTRVTSLPRLDEDQKEGFSNGMAFWLRWNDIVLVNSNNSGFLRQSFMVRPGKLCLPSECNALASFTSTTLTLSAAPQAGFVVGAKVDLVSAEGGHEYKAIDATITSVSGNDVGLDRIPSHLTPGDWLTPQYKSPVPQLPDDLMPALAQRAVVQINESGGYWDQREAAMATYTEMVDGILKLVSPRVKGEAKRIVAFASRPGRGV
jgi:hypothetical protein